MYTTDQQMVHAASVKAASERRSVVKIERWVHDHSIAIVAIYNDGSSAMQVLKLVHFAMFEDAMRKVKFAGLMWDDDPVRIHAQVQNSRRYAQRNLF